MTYTLSTEKPISVVVDEETNAFNQIALAHITTSVIDREEGRGLLRNYIAALDNLNDDSWTQGILKEKVYDEDVNGGGENYGTSATCDLVFKHFGNENLPKMIHFTLSNVTTSNLLSKVTAWSNETFDDDYLLTEYVCTCAIFDLG